MQSRHIPILLSKSREGSRREMADTSLPLETLDRVGERTRTAEQVRLDLTWTTRSAFHELVGSGGLLWGLCICVYRARADST